MIKGITEIVYVKDLGFTPASVNRETGVMYISLKHIKKMSKEAIFFMMLHEKAHAQYQTRSEIEADAKAFEEYAASGYSLKKGLEALTLVLDERNPEHKLRMNLQYERAKAYDLIHNGNTKFLN